MSKQLFSTIGECQIVDDSVNRLCNLSRTAGSVSRLDIIYLGDDRTNVHSEDEVHVVNDFVLKMIGKSVLIFTDGSVQCKQERSVGPGACAVVMCPLQVDGLESTFTRAVEKHTDIFSCEAEAIVLGLEKVEEY